MVWLRTRLNLNIIRNRSLNHVVIFGLRRRFWDPDEYIDELMQD